MALIELRNVVGGYGGAPILNGVNMGLTYRNQFNGAMNDPKYGGDMDKVIDSWGKLVEEEGPDLDAADTEAGEQEA